jgi:undecaprenyl-diphosphatase
VASGLCAVALVALTAVVASTHAPAWELDVVEAATDAPDVVGYPARGLMVFGTLTGVVVVALVAGLVWHRWRAAAALAITAVVAWLLSARIKDLADRGRPTGVRLRDHADGFGYTSSHTAVAFALATVAAPLLPPRWRWLPWTVAAVVGLARMHVGVHYPVDVLGGALLGVSLGLATLAVFRYAPERGPRG